MIFITMKKKPTYKEIQETDYIIKMMEDVFGHRLTSWNPKDTAMLKGKLYQPIGDDEKEKFVAVIEPLMKKKSFVPSQRDKFLDAFLDLDTRISQSDYEPDEDTEAEKMDKFLGTDLT